MRKVNHIQAGYLRVFTDMKNKLIISCLAIIVLGAMECFALSKGIDGALFGSVIALIGGIAGYTIKSKVTKDKAQK